jgi:hypothetical protein
MWGNSGRNTGRGIVGYYGERNETISLRNRRKYYGPGAVISSSGPGAVKTPKKQKCKKTLLCMRDQG